MSAEPSASRIEPSASRIVIAVDGPAGSGKSTVARALARKLGVRHVDTGAMYRALALKLLRQSVDIEDQSRIEHLLEATYIRLVNGKVLLDEQDVTALIRTGEVTRASSRVAQIQPVRMWMVIRQRELVNNGEGAVVEGRDIGTVVLPDAPLKIFLTASESERARRRSSESGVSAEQTAAEMARRDQQDSTRTHSPLHRADDAVEVDTTGLTVEQVVDRILEFLASGPQPGAPGKEKA